MEKNPDRLWDEIGFVRPLGGFLYNIVLVVAGSIFGIFFSVWFLPNIVYPFPEAMGFENMVKSLFAFYFAIADVGLGTAIQRFIGEAYIKNPKKSVQYLQFFIYFQMFTGLIQISILSIWVFTAATESELAYAAWFFLLYSTIQWPGMLGVFQGTLQAYQRFDRANVVTFIQAIVLENSTRVVCILIGRYFGANDPQIGEIMGATIGSIVGAYMDDFLAAILAVRWSLPIIRKIDPSYSFKTFFIPQFDWQLAKETLSYGFKVMLQGIIFPGANLVAVFVLINYLNNYPTIWGIYLIAEMIGAVVGAFGFEFTSSFSEAYMNGKRRLAADYISRIYIWGTLFGSMMVGLLFAGAPLIGVIVGPSFAAAVPLIQVFIIFEIMEVIIKAHDKVFRGGNKPEYNIIVLLVEQSARIGFLYLFLVPIPLSGMAIVLSRGLGWVVKWFISYWMIQWKMLKFRVNIWQTIIAPLGAALVEIGYISVLNWFLHPLLEPLVSPVIGAVIIIALGLLTGPLLIWLPTYSYLGGWDPSSLEILEKAYLISGPSKKIVAILLGVARKVSRKSPFYGKFPLDITGVKEEIADLMVQKSLIESNGTSI
jgi:O-antigen/teichoic acid export membrane protein